MAILLKLFFGFVIVSCLIVAIFCYNECVDKTKRWHKDVAVKLEKMFNLRSDIAIKLVRGYYPMWPMLLKDHLHPDLAASEIFWDPNVQVQLNSFCYIGRQVPTHLFTPEYFGRVHIEA